MTDLKLPVDLETILAFARKCKSDRMCVNEGVLSDTTDSPDTYTTAYGRPTLQVVAQTWDHIWDCPWDHTLESIRECAEIAQLHRGWVLVEYPIIIADPRCEETGRVLDTGFEIQVYPKFALRTHNSFVEMGGDEDEQSVEVADGN